MIDGQAKMIKPKNPNVNVLEGMCCPKCGSCGPFYIAITMYARIHDDGTELEGDTDWDDESSCVCIYGYIETDPVRRCQFAGKVKDFKED